MPYIPLSLGPTLEQICFASHPYTRFLLAYSLVVLKHGVRSRITAFLMIHASAMLMLYILRTYSYGHGILLLGASVETCFGYCLSSFYTALLLDSQALDSFPKTSTEYLAVLRVPLVQGSGLLLVQRSGPGH
jgi:hypothetical protein